MGKKNRVDATEVSDVAINTYKELKTMYEKLKSAKNNIDKLAHGEDGIAFWSGTRAVEWYANSYKNIANSLVRVAKMADAEVVLIRYALDSYNKDKDDSKGSLKTYKKLLIDLRDDCKTTANKLAPGSK